VDRLLSEHPDWSDREVARHVGVSHTTVAIHRRGGRIDHPSGGNRSAPGSDESPGEQAARRFVAVVDTLAHKGGPHVPALVLEEIEARYGSEEGAKVVDFLGRLVAELEGVA
jgi:hypothetical protein